MCCQVLFNCDLFLFETQNQSEIEKKNEKRFWQIRIGKLTKFTNKNVKIFKFQSTIWITDLFTLGFWLIEMNWLKCGRIREKNNLIKKGMSHGHFTWSEERTKLERRNNSQRDLTHVNESVDNEEKKNK